MNALVLDYLRASSLDYTIAAFLSEAPYAGPKDQQQAPHREEVLRALGLHVGERERIKGGVVSRLTSKAALLDAEERSGWRSRDREWLRFMKGEDPAPGDAAASRSVYGDLLGAHGLALTRGSKSSRGDRALALRDMRRELELDYDSEDEVVARPEESLLGAMVTALKLAPQPKHLCEMAVDTRGIEELSQGSGLEWRLRQIEEDGERRKREEVGDRGRSIEERLQAYMREERQRCEQEIKERVARIERDLVTRVRNEERVKFATELKAARERVEAERARDIAAIREREEQERGERERRERERESNLFRQRQECLSVMEAVRRKEDEVRSAHVFLFC
jgi:hypothetical protein